MHAIVATAAIRPCPATGRPAAAARGAASARAPQRARLHIARAQSDEERAAALKAALEQAQSNPEVREVGGAEVCAASQPSSKL